MFGKSPLQPLKNKDLEKILEKNMQLAKPIEYREKLTPEGTKMFPFWKPVTPEMPDIIEDTKEYLKNRSDYFRSVTKFSTMSPLEKMEKLKTDLTEKKPSNIWKSENIMGAMNDWLSHVNAFKDPNLMGVVDPKHAETLNDTTETKVVTKADWTNPVEIQKASPDVNVPPQVVAPKSEYFDNNKKVEQITHADWTKEQILEVKKASEQLKKGVQPQLIQPKVYGDLIKTSGTKPITSIDWTKDNPVIVIKA